MTRRQLLAFVCVLLGACQSAPPKHYFMLTAPSNQPAQVQQAIDTLIGIGPIELAEYLARPQLAVQKADGSINLLVNNVWAEPLDRGIARILAMNLIAQDDRRGAVYFPWRTDSQPRFSVRVQIHSLGQTDNLLKLQASWELIDAQNSQKSQRWHFNQTVKAQTNAQGLANGISELIENLSRQINTALVDITESR